MSGGCQNPYNLKITLVAELCGEGNFFFREFGYLPVLYAQTTCNVKERWLVSLFLHADVDKMLSSVENVPLLLE